jgi:hypothetical protein
MHCPGRCLEELRTLLKYAECRSPGLVLNRTLTFQEGRNADNWTATLNVDTHQSNLGFTWRVYFSLKLKQNFSECASTSNALNHSHPTRHNWNCVTLQSNCDPFISTAVKQCHSVAVCLWTLHRRLVALQPIKQNRTANCTLDACRLPKPTGRIVTGLRGEGGWVMGFRSERDNRRTFLWICVHIRRRAVYHLWLGIKALKK